MQRVNHRDRWVTGNDCLDRRDREMSDRAGASHGQDPGEPGLIWRGGRFILNNHC